MSNLKKFGFEILIIFTGITLSFLFDEWRSDRNELIRTNEILRTIDIEISDYFKNGHRILARRDSLTSKYQSKTISADELADLLVYINADPANWTKKLVVLDQITKNESILRLNDVKLVQSLGRIYVYVDLMTATSQTKYNYLTNSFYGFLFDLGVVYDVNSGRFLANEADLKNLLSNKEFNRHMNTILTQVSDEDLFLKLFDKELSLLQSEIKMKLE